MDGWVATPEGYSRDEGEVLRVEDLTVRYGALVALRGVSWSVRAGEILGIIGPNGAGKSSCFAAVTNAVAHVGRTFLDDSDVSQIRTYDLASRGLRRTFQHNSFFGELYLRRFELDLAGRGIRVARIRLRRRFCPPGGNLRSLSRPKPVSQALRSRPGLEMREWYWAGSPKERRWQPR
jgi:ABC-type uncharacterized transport system ATPase subunit